MLYIHGERVALNMCLKLFGTWNQELQLVYALSIVICLS